LVALWTPESALVVLIDLIVAMELLVVASVELLVIVFLSSKSVWLVV
jgi:hypothetical protein